MERIVQNRRFLDPKGGGTLIFSYILRLGSFFYFFFGGGGSKFGILLFFLGGGFRNMNIFGGTKIFWIFFGGSDPK